MRKRIFCILALCSAIHKAAPAVEFGAGMLLPAEAWGTVQQVERSSLVPHRLRAMMPRFNPPMMSGFLTRIANLALAGRRNRSSARVAPVSRTERIDKVLAEQGVVQTADELALHIDQLEQPAERDPSNSSTFNHGTPEVVAVVPAPADAPMRLDVSSRSSGIEFISMLSGEAMSLPTVVRELFKRAVNYRRGSHQVVGSRPAGVCSGYSLPLGEEKVLHLLDPHALVKELCQGSGLNTLDDLVSACNPDRPFMDHFGDKEFSMEQLMQILYSLYSYMEWKDLFKVYGVADLINKISYAMLREEDKVRFDDIKASLIEYADTALPGDLATDPDWKKKIEGCNPELLMALYRILEGRAFDRDSILPDGNLNLNIAYQLFQQVRPAIDADKARRVDASTAADMAKYLAELGSSARRHAQGWLTMLGMAR